MFDFVRKIGNQSITIAYMLGREITHMEVERKCFQKGITVTLVFFLADVTLSTEEVFYCLMTEIRWEKNPVDKQVEKKIESFTCPF